MSAAPHRLPWLTTVAFVLLCAWALTGLGCKPRNTDGPRFSSDLTLTVWGLWQESAHLEPIFTAFQEQTGATVEYKKIASVADYERKLLEAIAEDRGPDLFVIHHSWVNTKQALLSPAPLEVVDEKAVREEFVDVVASDLVRQGQVYALPTSVDTLALYYNKDILAASGVARPPRTWEEFQQVVERLTRVSRFSTIEQSAAALGTARNVSRAADIVQLLMLQSGLPIAQGSGVAINNEQGIRSLRFYTDFANKSKQVYTWDLQQDYSIDAFAEGETAMMIGYAYHRPIIGAKNPRLRFDVAPVPQIADSQPVNFAAYWPFAVSRSSPNAAAAWQLLRFLTAAENAAVINATAGTPPAHRVAIEQQLRDPFFGVFAQQALTAATWPRPDVVAVDGAITTMIDSVITGAATVEESIARGETQLNQLILQPET